MTPPTAEEVQAALEWLADWHNNPVTVNVGKAASRHAAVLLRWLRHIDINYDLADYRPSVRIPQITCTTSK